jgi:hypothetical protein
MATSPSKLLDRVLKLIDQDTKRITKELRRESRVLDKDTAATLCKYATTIQGIKAEQEAEDQKLKSRLERLSTEELIELHRTKTKTAARVTAKG